MPTSVRRAPSPNMSARRSWRSATTISTASRRCQLPSNPSYAADLFRHAASYFGNADAQYGLARLYLNGEGVEKDTGLAVNWLAMAAKKQHVAAQATLGEMLWRGNDVRQREARGLALITLAHENAKASGKEPKWIGDLYQEAFTTSDSRDPQGGCGAAAGTRRHSRRRDRSGRRARSLPIRIVVPAIGAPRQSRSRQPLLARHSRLPPCRSASRARRRRRRSGSRSASAPRAPRPKGSSPEAALDGELDEDRHVV